MISIQEASCGYNGKVILPDVSFSFQKGEAVCVLGANGVGKTTLFRTLLGLLPLLGGDILIEGSSLKKLSHRKLAKLVAYVPQAKSLSYQHPVEDVILMGRAQYIKTFDVPSAEDYSIVKEVMASLNISHMFGLPYSVDLSPQKLLVLICGRSLSSGPKKPFILDMCLIPPITMAPMLGICVCLKDSRLFWIPMKLKFL